MWKKKEKKKEKNPMTNQIVSSHFDQRFLYSPGLLKNIFFMFRNVPCF